MADLLDDSIAHGMMQRVREERSARELATTRKAWLKAQIKAIQEGADLQMSCVMATSDRIAAGLCAGPIPSDRVRAGRDTCSPDCQADKRRLRREEAAKKKCRFCGNGLAKKQRQDLAAANRGRKTA